MVAECLTSTPIAFAPALCHDRGIASNDGSDEVEAPVADEPAISAMDSPWRLWLPLWRGRREMLWERVKGNKKLRGILIHL